MTSEQVHSSLSLHSAAGLCCAATGVRAAALTAALRARRAWRLAGRQPGRMAGAHRQQRRRRGRRPPAAQVSPGNDVAVTVLIASLSVWLVLLCHWPQNLLHDVKPGEEEGLPTCTHPHCGAAHSVWTWACLQRLCDGAAQVHRQPGRQRGGARHGAAAGGAARRLAGPGRGAGAFWVPAPSRDADRFAWGGRKDPRHYMGKECYHDFVTTSQHCSTYQYVWRLVTRFWFCHDRFGKQVDCQCRLKAHYCHAGSSRPQVCTHLAAAAAGRPQRGWRRPKRQRERQQRGIHPGIQPSIRQGCPAARSGSCAAVARADLQHHRWAASEGCCWNQPAWTVMTLHRCFGIALQCSQGWPSHCSAGVRAGSWSMTALNS